MSNGNNKQIVTDHDLLMKLATDMMWVKRILFASIVPITLASFKFLLSWTP